MVKKITFDAAGPEHALIVLKSLGVDPVQAKQCRRAMEQQGLVVSHETRLQNNVRVMMGAVGTMKDARTALTQSSASGKNRIVG